ncbi:hypothetical protein U8607_10795 [Methylobacterium durans]|uniref:hypothetical protein n=1 Tax=Methylobacterium durans TaxID=2202825 RepID=UPI002AFDEADD|nr:hypothetical protein [Methylobacterium durans]MEA1832568.1 hypothetical protein [Methylobacterium durans]
MTVLNLSRRLGRIEAAHGFRGDIAQASGAQLWSIIRGGCRALEAENRSLVQAVQHLRGTGNPGDAGLADLIAEDMENRP